MSDHRVHVTLEPDSLTAKVICSAGASAPCRAVNADPLCECESWLVDHDEGGPYHDAHVYDDGCDMPGVIRHRMRFDGTTCNIVDSFSDGYTEEYYTGREVVIADLAIDTGWDFDVATWDLASDMRTPGAGALMFDHVAGQLTVDEVLTEHGATA